MQWKEVGSIKVQESALVLSAEPYAVRDRLPGNNVQDALKMIVDI